MGSIPMQPVALILIVALGFGLALDHLYHRKRKRDQKQ
jgi:hypothetical protein